MKALDTNVLVRFLVGDDRRMMDRVNGLLEDAHDEGEAFFVSDLVVLEMIWVLESRYGLAKSDILDSLEKLNSMPTLEFESGDVLNALMRNVRSSPLNPADVFIGLCAKNRGCEATLTFDKKAAKSDLFELL